MGRFVPNVGIAAIPHDPAFVSMVKARGEAVERRARDLALSEATNTGHYAASIKTDVHLDGLGWYARVTAGDWKSWWIEMGTRGPLAGVTDGHAWRHFATPKRRILGRALDAARSL